MQLLQTVRTLKPKCVSFKGIDYDNLATLLSESGYLTCTQAPALECKCKTRSRKCLERLTHTYLVCNGSAKPPRLTVGISSVELFSETGCLLLPLVGDTALMFWLGCIGQLGTVWQYLQIIIDLTSFDIILANTKGKRPYEGNYTFL